MAALQRPCVEQLELGRLFYQPAARDQGPASLWCGGQHWRRPLRPRRRRRSGAPAPRGASARPSVSPCLLGAAAVLGPLAHAPNAYTLFLSLSLAHTHTRTHARTHARTYTHTLTHARTDGRTHARTHARARARARARTHTHTRTHAHGHTHTKHTHTQTHTTQAYSRRGSTAETRTTCAPPSAPAPGWAGWGCASLVPGACSSRGTARRVLRGSRDDGRDVAIWDLSPGSRGFPGFCGGAAPSRPFAFPPCTRHPACAFPGGRVAHRLCEQLFVPSHPRRR